MKSMDRIVYGGGRKHGQRTKAKADFLKKVEAAVTDLLGDGPNPIGTYSLCYSEVKRAVCVTVQILKYE